MPQVRFHGRGGQGVVTSAELLATAALLDGRHARALASVCVTHGHSSSGSMSIA